MSNIIFNQKSWRLKINHVLVSECRISGSVVDMFLQKKEADEIKQNWRVQFSENHCLVLSGHTGVKWSLQTAGLASLCNWLGPSQPLLQTMFCSSLFLWVAFLWCYFWIYSKWLSLLLLMRFREEDSTALSDSLYYKYFRILSRNASLFLLHLISSLSELVEIEMRPPLPSPRVALMTYDPMKVV